MRLHVYKLKSSYMRSCSNGTRAIVEGATNAGDEIETFYDPL